MADGGIYPTFSLEHGLTMSLYYRDPEGNFVELQIDNFGDWKLSTEFMSTSDDFRRNPIGTFFDPERVYQAYKAGTERAAVRAGHYLPATSPDLGLPPPQKEMVGVL